MGKWFKKQKKQAALDKIENVIETAMEDGILTNDELVEIELAIMGQEDTDCTRCSYWIKNTLVDGEYKYTCAKLLVVNGECDSFNKKGK